MPSHKTLLHSGDRLTSIRRSYQELGFTIHPTPPGKKFGYKGWAEDSTTDPGILTKFSPGDGTMAHMGLSGLFTFDLDRHGNGIDGVANFKKLARKHALKFPKTRIHTTPSDGRHVFYLQNPECHISTSHGRLAPGVDIKADRSLVMLPPTEGYTPVAEHTIAVVPVETAQLIAALTSAGPQVSRTDVAGGTQQHSISGIMQTLCNAGQGERNATLYWALNRVAEMPAGKHHRLIRQISREASHLGLPDWEINQTIDSVFGGPRG